MIELFNLTSNGIFSIPSLPKAPSSLQPKVNTFPYVEVIIVCKAPQAILLIDNFDRRLGII
jgi:hypothetical protein